MRINTSLSLTILFLFLLVSACTKSDQEATDDKPNSLSISFPEALFTEPEAIAQRKASPIIMNRLISLINASAPSSTIHISIFGCDYPALTTALRNAATRKVNVNLMLDMSSEDTKKENAKIENDLKNIPGIQITIVINDAGNIAINHNKFAIFSKIETSSGIQENIVFHTSHNFTTADTRKLQDAVTVQELGLYNAFKKYWEDVQLRASRGMIFFDYREYANTDQSLFVSFMPKRKENQFYGEDTIIEILDAIDEPEGANIYIGMSGWTDTRMNIVEKLEELLVHGANVQVITKRADSPNIENRLRALEEKGAYIKIFAESKINIHSKYMLIDAKWKGNDSKIVINGSQNFTRNALRYNNEVTMILNHPSIFEAYYNNFKQIKELPE